jgi:hypothetical protein
MQRVWSVVALLQRNPHWLSRISFRIASNLQAETLVWSGQDRACKLLQSSRYCQCLSPFHAIHLRSTPKTMQRVAAYKRRLARAGMFLGLVALHSTRPYQAVPCTAPFQPTVWWNHTRPRDCEINMTPMGYSGRTQITGNIEDIQLFPM